MSLQARVFLLVAATFSTIYLTQPVLPVLREEFGIDAAKASLTVSAVIFGIALATLPFGRLADRFPARPIILSGGTLASLCGFLCAATTSFPLLVAARFLQGVFVPSLTTCLVVYLVRRLPPERLNVAMGAYVSATVAGGLGGRLLAGFLHPPLHWRYAFVTASALLLLATLDAGRWLPREEKILDAGGGHGIRRAALPSRPVADLLRGRGVVRRLLLRIQLPAVSPRRAAVPAADAPHHVAVPFLPGRRRDRPVGGAAREPGGQRDRDGDRGGRIRRFRPPHAGPARCGRGRVAGRGVRRFFHRAYRRGGSVEPEAGGRPREGKLPVRPLLLSRGDGGDHGERPGIPPRGVAGRGRPGGGPPADPRHRGDPGGPVGSSKDRSRPFR